MPGEPGHDSDGTTVRALPNGWWIGGRVLAKPACRGARPAGVSLCPGGAADRTPCGMQRNHLLECLALDRCTREPRRHVRTDACLRFDRRPAGRLVQPAR